MCYLKVHVVWIRPSKWRSGYQEKGQVFLFNPCKILAEEIHFACVNMVKKIQEKMQ